MFNSVIFLAIIASVVAGYSDTSDNTVGGNVQYGAGFPGIPFPQFDNFDFPKFFTNYFENLQKFHQELAAKGNTYAYSFTSNNSKARASASVSFTSDGGGIQKNAGQYGNGGYGFSGSFPNGGYGGGFSGSFGGGDGSVASASIGPNGVHQKAAVYPENPNVPNVDARFGATKSGGGGGLYSVFTSSQSETANVNGKPVSRQQASTTVNDNGKVSTYTVHNP